MNAINRDDCVDEIPFGYTKTVEFAWLIGRLDSERWLFQRCESNSGLKDVWLMVPEYFLSGK